jgi:glycosyltransferase involved in cell wall biosynthesis
VASAAESEQRIRTELYPAASDNVILRAPDTSEAPVGVIGGADDRRLRIAMLAPPWIPVPPPGYGGIELVVALLCDALVAKGHDVDLFSAPGSTSTEKGRHRAIEVARAARRPLVLAGPVQPGCEQLFREEVEPHIDGETIRYVGEVGGARKQRLFANASALLMPIRWPEPFGMVMVEALAAGTPVLAFAQGSAPEVIEHGETGFLVDDEREMAALVEHVGVIDPQRCRSSVAERFAPDRVAAFYEKVYFETLRRGAPVRLEAPQVLALAA